MRDGDPLNPASGGGFYSSSERRIGYNAPRLTTSHARANIPSDHPQLVGNAHMVVAAIILWSSRANNELTGTQAIVAQNKSILQDAR